jgi:hypothetical protein
MGIKRWLHATIGSLLGVRMFWCRCDPCSLTWSSPGPVSEALTSLRRHGVDYHGGVDLTD